MVPLVRSSHGRRESLLRRREDFEVAGTVRIELTSREFGAPVALPWNMRPYRSVVRLAGLEPAPPEEDKALNLARLPFPPQPHELYWCRGGGSNPYARRPRVLSPGCLPIPAPRQGSRDEGLGDGVSFPGVSLPRGTCRFERLQPPFPKGGARLPKARTVSLSAPRWCPRGESNPYPLSGTRS